MRWQDYLILLLLLAAYMVYLVAGKRRLKGKLSGRRQQLTRREQEMLTRLKTEGYRLEEAHPGVEVTLSVDQKSRPFNHRGAFIVNKNGKNFLVKIRRGDATPLTSSALRSEMLLDYLLFQLDGLLFYDPEKERFQKLLFQLGGVSRLFERRLLQIALVLLIATGLILLYRLTGGCR